MLDVARDPVCIKLFGNYCAISPQDRAELVVRNLSGRTFHIYITEERPGPYRLSSRLKSQVGIYGIMV